MSTILDKIVEQTALDVAKRKSKVAYSDFNSFKNYAKTRIDFKKALNRPNTVSVIAEIKKASPSKGIIREDFDPIRIANQYIEGGAAALSILTDEPFFKGSLSYLNDVAAFSNIPLLRKDFIIDPYQIEEAKAHGADAVLIIVAITDGGQLTELLHAAKESGLDALVECYDLDDFDRLDFDMVDILGVNNRDLKDFKVDVHRGISILQKAPKDTVLVSESGLSTGADLALLRKENIHSALIGEALMRQPDPKVALKELLKETTEQFDTLYSGK